MKYEPERYQLELEQIVQFFGGKRILTRKDVSRYVGRSVDYCRDHMKIPGDGITAVKLAVMLAKM